MKIFNKKKLITHDGSFHSDDVFAAAAFSLMLEKDGVSFEIIRTRDEDIIETGDYVFDVGGVHDVEKNRFDHHQVGGAGKRPNGIEYAAFGLVWKKFGKILAGSEKSAAMIDKKLVSPIDAWDNGYDLVANKYEITPYYMQHIFFAMHPTWKEEDVNIDGVFLECVEMAKKVLTREIIQAKDLIEAEEAVMATYNASPDKRIIILEKNYPFEYVLHALSEPLYAVYPRKTEGSWGVKAIRQDPKSFINRKNLPKAWAGLQGEELVNVSGVSDAIFCHRGLWLAGAKSKEGAIKLAQIAVES
ncbi:MAG: MYG1 family protein [Minisyncoccia bacterium]